MEVSGRTQPEVIDGVLASMELQDEQKEYGMRLVDRVVESHEEIDRHLEESLVNWRLDRTAVLDRILLRLGAAELLYFADVPARVAITEAAALGRKFSTEDSGAFLNGVLNSLMEKISNLGASKT